MTDLFDPAPVAVSQLVNGTTQPTDLRDQRLRRGWQLDAFHEDSRQLGFYQATKEERKRQRHMEKAKTRVIISVCLVAIIANIGLLLAHPSASVIVLTAITLVVMIGILAFHVLDLLTIDVDPEQDETDWKIRQQERACLELRQQLRREL